MEKELRLVARSSLPYFTIPGQLLIGLVIPMPDPSIPMYSISYHYILRPAIPMYITFCHLCGQIRSVHPRHCFAEYDLPFTFWSLSW